MNPVHDTVMIMSTSVGVMPAVARHCFGRLPSQAHRMFLVLAVRLLQRPRLDESTRQERSSGAGTPARCRSPSSWRRGADRRGRRPCACSTSRSRASAGDRERPWPSRRSSRMGCARRRSVIGRSWNRLCRWTARRSARVCRLPAVRGSAQQDMFRGRAPGPATGRKPRCYVRSKPVSQWVSGAGRSRGLRASRGPRPSGFADRGCTAGFQRGPAASRRDA